MRKKLMKKSIHRRITAKDIKELKNFKGINMLRVYASLISEEHDTTSLQIKKLLSMLGIKHTLTEMTMAADKEKYF